MNTKELGLNIQKARKERGLTQIELAKKIDKSKRTLQHYEAGTVNIPLDVLSKIEDALDVPFVKPRIRKNDNYKTFIDFLETININVTETTDGFFVSCDDISEDKTYKFTITTQEFAILKEKINSMVKNEFKYLKPDAREVLQLFNERNRIE